MATQQLFNNIPLDPNSPYNLPPQSETSPYFETGRSDRGAPAIEGIGSANLDNFKFYLPTIALRDIMMRESANRLGATGARSNLNFSSAMTQGLGGARLVNEDLSRQQAMANAGDFLHDYSAKSTYGKALDAARMLSAQIQETRKNVRLTRKKNKPQSFGQAFVEGLAPDQLASSIGTSYGSRLQQEANEYFTPTQQPVFSDSRALNTGAR